MTNLHYIINEMPLQEFCEKFGRMFMHKLQEAIKWNDCEKRIFNYLFSDRQGFIDCLIYLLPDSGNSAADFANVFWIDIIKNYEKEFDWSSYEDWDLHRIRNGSCEKEAQMWLEKEK